MNPFKRIKSHPTTHDSCIITFTKKWINRLMWFSVSWITLSYILAFCGKESIAESLSQTVANVIVSVFVAYLCKSFFETYSEEHNKLKREQLTNSESEVGDDNDESEV